MIDMEIANISIAYENLHKGYDKFQVFEVMVRNLGFKCIKSDSVVKYNPLIHEDVVSGMLPGDDAKIVRTGYEYPNSNRIIRAHVIRA